jgi:hypothetical protein
MTVKIKFLKNPVSQVKFLHNLVNAKKRNSNYKHLHHYVIDEAKDKVSFHLNDENGEVVVCDIDFYPNENLVDIEVHPCDFGKLQSLLVFDLLESINEEAVVRFIDEKFYFDGGMDFYIVIDGKKEIIRKVSSDRENLLEVTSARIIGQVMTEIRALD